eukprot:sb/3462737/
MTQVLLPSGSTKASEAGTELAVFESDPVVMQARKMSKLVPNQDVVTTCRYILFKQPLEFHDALASCLALEWPITNTGIGMATVRTEAENDDVSNLIRIGFGFKFDGKKPYKYGNWALIGLSKRRNNDYKLSEEEAGVFNPEDWWFSNGMRTNYTKWHTGFPDQQEKGKKTNKEYQNWVQINKKGYWDDTYSSKKLPYLCEYCGKYIVLSKHVTWDKANAHCQDLGLEFAVEAGTELAVFESDPVVMQARKMSKLVPNQDVVTTCRYILFKQPLEFHDALASCLALEWPITNTVVNYHSNISCMAAPYPILFSNLSERQCGKKPYKYGNWALIGLSKRRNNDYKLSEEEAGVFNPEDWWFSNGMRTNYTKWHTGFPDQQEKGKKKNKEYQNWVQINKKGYWDDTYSSKKLPYLCEYCGKYIVLSKHVTWDKANAHCQDLGLEFAVVNSQSDNDELLFAARVSLGEELGGRRFNNSNWVWIGTQEVMDETTGNGTGVWQHWNGASLDFSPSWDFKVQPDNWVLPNKGGGLRTCTKFPNSRCQFGETHPNSQSDNDELLFAARVSLGEELGGRRFNNSNWVWIGTQEVLDETTGNGTGVWQHWNGASLDFSPSWDYKVQPDNWVLPNKGEQNVVGFSRKDGKWDDSFKFRKRPFACQCPHRGCSYSAYVSEMM